MTDLRSLTPPEPCVLTIGVFDGVHLGHAGIVRRCRKLSDDEGAAAVALTFDRPPEYVVCPERAQAQLLPLARRVGLLREAGASHVVVLTFDEEMAATSAEDFARDLLASGDVRTVVVGENFRFGAGGRGDIEVLAAAGALRHVPIVEEPLLTLDGAPVSSTRIRRALQDGDVDAAARMLGRRPEIEGIVVGGVGRGRELGYPTANLSVPETILVPADGVYAGRAMWGSSVAAAAVSIGTSPTFAADVSGTPPSIRFAGHSGASSDRAAQGSGTPSSIRFASHSGGVPDTSAARGAPPHRVVEAHLLDVCEELLGQELRLELDARLRRQERYESAEALAAAIGEDVAATRRVERALLSRGRSAELPQQDR